MGRKRLLAVGALAVLAVVALPQTSASGEFRINTQTTGRQWRVSGAAFTADRFVLAWQSDGQDGSGVGVFGLRYGDVIFQDGFEPADS
jgi:hypothetical protein